jgi:hypothetical protein
MKNIFKLVGIMVIALMVITCTPKKTENNVAHEAVITELQTQFDSLNQSEAEIQPEQTSDLPKVMYVDALEGLRVRNSPNIDGDRIGLLPHLANVNVINEDIDYITIDSIKGKWVLIQFITPFNLAYGNKPLEGWVFNRYLMDWSEDDYQNHLNNINFELFFQTGNAQNIAGSWIPGFINSGSGNYWTRYSFESNGKYNRSTLETSFGASGTWQVKDNSLFLNQAEQGDYEPVVNEQPLSYVYKFAVIGNNTLLWRSVDQENKLTQIFYRNE